MRVTGGKLIKQSLPRAEFVLLVPEPKWGTGGWFVHRREGFLWGLFQSRAGRLLCAWAMSTLFTLE